MKALTMGTTCVFIILMASNSMNTGIMMAVKPKPSCMK